MMHPVDPVPVWKVIIEHPGTIVPTIMEIMGITRGMARSFLRSARDKKLIICLGRGNQAAWYDMAFYLENKEELDKKHNVKSAMEYKELRDKNKRCEGSRHVNWKEQVLYLDRLMRVRLA